MLDSDAGPEKTRRPTSGLVASSQQRISDRTSGHTASLRGTGGGSQGSWVLALAGMITMARGAGAFAAPWRGVADQAACSCLSPFRRVGDWAKWRRMETLQSPVRPLAGPATPRLSLRVGPWHRQTEPQHHLVSRLGRFNLNLNLHCQAVSTVQFPVCRQDIRPVTFSNLQCY